MTENERISHQLDLANTMAKGKVVTPCVSTKNSNGVNEIASRCEYLDVKNGCQKDNGFVLESGKSVSCPDGRGRIIIHTEDIVELMQNREQSLAVKPQSAYAYEISKMEIDGSLSQTAEERSFIFI